MDPDRTLGKEKSASFLFSERYDACPSARASSGSDELAATASLDDVARGAAAAERCDWDRTLFTGCRNCYHPVGRVRIFAAIFEGEADEQLRAFAESIGSHFKAELQLAIRQLRRLDNIASQENAQSKASILEHSLDWKDVYLPFEYADWINSDGEKTIRWTPKRTPPQRVNVVDRGYFQDIKLDTALFLPDISPEKFAIEQVLSRTSGQAATMIAIASKLSKVTSRPLR